MLYIACALYDEAEPFIREYRLKKVDFLPRMQLFAGNDCKLVITGIGKLAASAGISALLSGEENLNDALVVNIGTCGSPTAGDIGKLFRVHRIEDVSSKKAYLPDLIVRSDIPERSLQTFDRAVTDPNDVRSTHTLVDMEASGFFSAALHFVAGTHIQCLKIVSDQLESGCLHKGRAADLISEHFHQIDRFVKEQRVLSSIDFDPIPDSGKEFYDSLCNRLRLTRQQQILFHKRLQAYSCRSQDFSELQREFCELTGENKRQRTQIFSALLERLSNDHLQSSV